ncbi:uncharacterized protein STEHIDRAFT_172942 [Stereum hirsutum FP-91666 SS1]|uniref:Uncharacterized protein n=1 Tax=Stereum hirsutum (strain FP-91666) TaxID=721885 RepID=R7RX45_STEHR|nr:uncharacterized protein STEHIDRAFT_172942 [Stereum hirsutum FP-91666 SS1]EIM79961.1 hypothetical protein STEHIDRAFT_172942 [Stereum hirsutum FP-91666 SS1]
MAHQAHVRHPSTSTHAPPPTTLHLTFTSPDPYNTTLVPSSPTATTGIAQSHSPSALSFSSSALADTPTPLPIHNGNGDRSISDEGGIWDGEERRGDSISIRVESPVSEYSAPRTSPASSSRSGSGSRGRGRSRSQSGSIQRPSGAHPHLTTTVAGSGIISASGSLMFAPTARGGAGPGGVGGSRTTTPVVRLGQRPRSSSGERSGGTSEVERPEALYVVVSPASSSVNQNQKTGGRVARTEYATWEGEGGGRGVGEQDAEEDSGEDEDARKGESGSR